MLRSMGCTAWRARAVALATLVGCSRAQPVVDPEPAPPGPRVSDADLPAPEDGLPGVEPTVVLELGSAVKLEHGPRMALRELVMRRIDDAPDDIEAPTEGEEVEAVLDVDGVEVRLIRSSSGYEADATRWVNDYRLTLLEIEPGARGVGIRVERATRRAIGSATPLRLEIQQEVELPDGSYVRLLGHGRERTATGEVGPLMVELMFWVWGGDFRRQRVSVAGNGSDWTFRGLRFVLRGYEFDRWMDVDVEQLAFEAVRAQ
jgi:hypothetical protein